MYSNSPDRGQTRNTFSRQLYGHTLQEAEYPLLVEVVVYSPPFGHECRLCEFC